MKQGREDRDMAKPALYQREIMGTLLVVYLLATAMSCRCWRCCFYKYCSSNEYLITQFTYFMKTFLSRLHEKFSFFFNFLREDEFFEYDATFSTH